MNTPAKQVHTLLDKYDGAVTLEVASAALWSGELRLTLSNPDGAPSRSMVFYAAGCDDPDLAMALLLADAKKWMRETGVVPMPVPEWMR